MRHQIQVTNIIRLSPAEYWFNWLKEKGADAAIYKVNSGYCVFREVEEGEKFVGYTSNNCHNKVEISADDYINNGSKYSVSPASEDIYKIRELFRE